jgi:ATP-binding cassette, subfamily B, bacterial
MVPRLGALLSRLENYLSVYRFTGRALKLVWATNRGLTILVAVLTLFGGVLPAAIAAVGREIIDGVVLAADTELAVDRQAALMWIGVELLLVAAMAAVQRGLDVGQTLQRMELGHKVNVLILDKALTLDLANFEDSETYDKLTRARRGASQRPLSVVQRSFGLVQNGIALTTYGALLLGFSVWTVLLLVVAAFPAFVAETRFAGEGFKLFRWKSPEYREQAYLEVVVAREDYAKEVKLLGLGRRLVDRYSEIFYRVFAEDRALTLRRGVWGFALGLLSTIALYGAYGWIGLATMDGLITLGAMTMYLLVFKQGQAAFTAILRAVGGMYEDNLYLSNLYEFLGLEVGDRGGDADGGPQPADGLRFEDVGFTYPGSDTPALSLVNLHIRPGERLALVGHNGSGKTTLVKLLTGLYSPDSGRITLEGRDLAEWEPGALRRRLGVIFQDFVKYQFSVGENIGVGDVDRVEDVEGQKHAAERGMAAEFIEDLPEKYETQLGRWFKDGRELSIGQWQKVALSRAFMRRNADVLVLDEPTAAMDAEAESQVFERVRDMAPDQMAILISHRFSTVRMADRIVVLHVGEVDEEGTHEELMALDGRYAALFRLQAAGYQ